MTTAYRIDYATGRKTLPLVTSIADRKAAERARERLAKALDIPVDDLAIVATKAKPAATLEEEEGDA